VPKWFDPTVSETVRKLLDERLEVLESFVAEKQPDVEKKLKEFFNKEITREEVDKVIAEIDAKMAELEAERCRLIEEYRRLRLEYYDLKEAMMDAKGEEKKKLMKKYFNYQKKKGDIKLAIEQLYSLRSHYRHVLRICSDLRRTLPPIVR